ncbi:MAG: VanW family protein, partial [Clostridia bacterium]|nr:VanW family protein [Clostridia bacterium]
YVEGFGGGVCQSSTTLYNALILSDIEILEAHSHSLPISYVPLAFDAMVSEGYADLKFKNNLDNPIFIKTWGDNEKVYVNIYGEPLAEDSKIERRVEYVKTLPHEGDMIVKDTKGEYADKITYAGEYFRLKYPQEGYHAKAYLNYYKDGKIVDEKLIRDEIYKPQKGVVMEGVAILGEGMELPQNDVKIISPQIKSKTDKKSVDKKIEEQNPANYNP